MSFEIDFPSRAISRQDISVAFDQGTFKAEISRARTFGFLHEVDRMRAAGLARGGSLDNAVVIDGDKVMNPGGLRYSDEFVRHKMLDAVGDLALAGAPIIGHFRGVRSGHAHTRQLLAALFADPDAWRATTLAEPAAFGTIAAPEPRRIARA
jgi:UDP-3-O-[3-hydroxymyristoyl] N-acetylglucosamine deacetylase